MIVGYINKNIMLRKREMMNWPDIIWYTGFNSTYHNIMVTLCLHESLHWRKPYRHVATIGYHAPPSGVGQVGPVRVFSKKWYTHPEKVSISLPDKGVSLIERRRDSKALKRPCECWGSTVPRPGQIYPWSAQLLEPIYFLFCLSWFEVGFWLLPTWRVWANTLQEYYWKNKICPE